MNNEIKPEIQNKKPLDPKKVKRIKLIGAAAVFLFLVVIIVVAIRPAKYVTCITYLGNEIRIQKVEGEYELPDETHEQVKRVGCTFKGWYTDKSFEEVYKYDPDTFTGNKLYAKYERIVYTITYHESANITPSNTPGSKIASSVYVWNPTSFFKKYDSDLGKDEAAVNAWGKVVETETDRVSVLYIDTPENIIAWEVYLASDVDFENALTVIEASYIEGYNVAKLSKEIIVGYANESGIVLKPIFR